MIEFGAHVLVGVGRLELVCRCSFDLHLSPVHSFLVAEFIRHKKCTLSVLMWVIRVTLSQEVSSVSTQLLSLQGLSSEPAAVGF